jgi:predicted nucleic acid-binding protein
LAADVLLVDDEAARLEAERRKIPVQGRWVFSILLPNMVFSPIYQGLLKN